MFLSKLIYELNLAHEEHGNINVTADGTTVDGLHFNGRDLSLDLELRKS